jgi:uncharacterized protein DUF6940
MWSLKTQRLAPGVLGAAALGGSVRMTFSQVISLWRSDETFVAEWVAQLAAIPFDAYCFEAPPLTKALLNEPFECVFVESPALARLAADSRPFQEHFRKAGGSVAFPSLGKDAWLVAPCPVNDSTCYTHLACFLRSAAREEVCQLWREVAKGLDARLADAPLWLSTAGLGVSWLHVRLDTRPKYYRHCIYASPGFWATRSQ